MYAPVQEIQIQIDGFFCKNELGCCLNKEVDLVDNGDPRGDEGRESRRKKISSVVSTEDSGRAKAMIPMTVAAL